MPQEIAKAIQNMPLEDKNDPLNIQIRANILTEFLKTRVLYIKDNAPLLEEKEEEDFYSTPKFINSNQDEHPEKTKKGFWLFVSIIVFLFVILLITFMIS